MNLIVEGNFVSEERKTKNGSYMKIFKDMKFHIKVTTDKEKIVADGIDTATIKAEIFDYQNNFINTFNDSIYFELDGNVQEIKASKGIASILFSSAVIGEYEINVSVPSYRGGNIKVVAE